MAISTAGGREVDSFVASLQNIEKIAAEAPANSLAARVERVAAPVREQVLNLLRREIVEMRLRPGQRLVERQLVDSFGVSRTTIREVLRGLAAEGLVTTIPQKGAIVAVPSAREAAELYEVRALLEGAASREFAARASDDHLARLRGALGALERSQDSPDPRVLLDAKNRFYDVLFEGAGNETIRSILEGLRARIALLRARSLTAPGRARESVAEIRAIVEAVGRRDGDAAAAAASHHVRRAAETLFELIGGEE
jgi:GntR family transcriptional regulator, trigonelline degradation regulator